MCVCKQLHVRLMRGGLKVREESEAVWHHSASANSRFLFITVDYFNHCLMCLSNNTSGWWCVCVPIQHINCHKYLHLELHYILCTFNSVNMQCIDSGKQSLISLSLGYSGAHEVTVYQIGRTDLDRLSVLQKIRFWCICVNPWLTGKGLIRVLNVNKYITTQSGQAPKNGTGSQKWLGTEEETKRHESHGLSIPLSLVMARFKSNVMYLGHADWVVRR